MYHNSYSASGALEYADATSFQRTVESTHELLLDAVWLKGERKFIGRLELLHNFVHILAPRARALTYARLIKNFDGRLIFLLDKKGKPATFFVWPCPMLSCRHVVFGCGTRRFMDTAVSGRTKPEYTLCGCMEQVRQLTLWDLL